MSETDVKNDDLSSILAQRAPRRRDRSTTILIALLILVVGMILGVPLGRMSAGIGQPISDSSGSSGQSGGFQDGPPDPGPAGRR
ncbi:MAG: hypothetical protein ACKOE2_09605 [Actinomycetales bacterium]